MDLTTFINPASTIVAAGATAILAVLTYRYVQLTAGMADVMRAAQEPSVVVTIEFPGHRMSLKIKNMGQSTATDLTFQVIQDLNWVGRSNRRGFSSLTIMDKGISYLAPGQELTFFVGIGRPKKEDLATNSILEIRFTFKNQAGKIFNREMTVDMSQFKDLLLDSFLNPVDRLTETLQSIEQDRRTRDNFPGQEMFLKACPVCAETIQKRAKKCPHCHEFIATEAAAVTQIDDHSGETSSESPAH